MCGFLFAPNCVAWSHSLRQPHPAPMPACSWITCIMTSCNETLFIAKIACACSRNRIIGLRHSNNSRHMAPLVFMWCYAFTSFIEVTFSTNGMEATSRICLPHVRSHALCMRLPLLYPIWLQHWIVSFPFLPMQSVQRVFALGECAR